MAEQISSEPTQSPAVPSTSVCSNTSPDIPIRKSQQVEVLRLRHEVNAVREQWHQEVERFEREDQRRKQIENDLRAEIAHLKIARDDRQKAGKNPLEEILFAKDEEIWFLKQKNHEMQRLAGFAQSIPKQPKSLPQKDISNALQAIGNELQSIFHGHDLGLPWFRPSMAEDTDLASLAAITFADSNGSGSLVQQLWNSLSKWGTVVVVRALAVAALRNWVFATEFPDFGRNGDPRILLAYRAAILTHGKLTSFDIQIHAD